MQIVQLHDLGHQEKEQVVSAVREFKHQGPACSNTKLLLCGAMHFAISGNDLGSMYNSAAQEDHCHLLT